MQQRLQKLLASAGVASRRSCEALIAAGRVTVNGEVVDRMGAQADPDVDDVRLDGKPIGGAAEHQTIALNKPIGYVTTVSDPHAEHTVMDLVKGAGGRIYPVGRLDADSAGLLLLTNDGDLAQLLTHPSHLVPKTYRVLVRGEMSEFAATDLRHGVQLEDGMTAPAQVVWVDYDREHNVTVFDISITEGRNRQVRRMMDVVGYPVLALTRMSIGNLSVAGLAPGTWRRLRPDEVAALRAAATTGMPTKEAQEPHTLENQEPKPADTVVHSTTQPTAPSTPDASRQRRPKQDGHAKPGGGHTKPRDAKPYSAGRDSGGKPARPAPGGQDRPRKRPDATVDRSRTTFGDKPAPQAVPPQASRYTRPGAPGDRPKPAFGGKPRGDAPSRPGDRRPKDRPQPGGDRAQPDWSATRPIEGHPGLGKRGPARPPRPWDSTGAQERPPARPARPDASRRGEGAGSRPAPGGPGSRPAAGGSGSRPAPGGPGKPAGPKRPAAGPGGGSGPEKRAAPRPPQSSKVDELKKEAQRLAETLGRDGPEERSETKPRPTNRAPKPKKDTPNA